MPNEQQLTKCPHCGASIKKYWHNLTPGLIDSLIQFAQAIKAKGRNRIHITKETGFNINQWCNFKKLRYFGLIAKDGKEKNGYWILTTNGLRFLRNETDVPARVLTFRGKKEDESKIRVKIGGFVPRTEDYWQKEFDFKIFQSRIF